MDQRKKVFRFNPDHFGEFYCLQTGKSVAFRVGFDSDGLESIELAGYSNSQRGHAEEIPWAERFSVVGEAARQFQMTYGHEPQIIHVWTNSKF